MRTLLPAALLALGLSSCGGAGDERPRAVADAEPEVQAGGGAAQAEAGAPTNGGASARDAEAADDSVELRAADLDAYARGLRKEIELVRAAQERALSATTPEERGAAAQAQWEDQTAPEGARAAGLSPERYRRTRDAVHRVLETLDFQGKIDGPMSIDASRASPEMRRRLESDPFEELSPPSAAALQARLDELVPLWAEYVELTAVAG